MRRQFEICYAFRHRAIVAELAGNASGVMLAIFSDHRGLIHTIPREPSDLGAQSIKDVQSNA
jgi:hypothetical protein